ncbi:T9SS type A sorting domain-containing protein [Spirosoma montaniterrae]|uniref:Secretion system C-terminal sorting domain-containing protein n=1 Tax=Spirosoma montaniterrae TaxID=1178516 RepID=A0A1P9X254_9BACT|nr:T9SS type A sorting domain-containing protein [Spirosoma montaniterrae]AQG81691.1 hypothetical protein AWR27_21730 [Spirosoma montaniterrae]
MKKTVFIGCRFALAFTLAGGLATAQQAESPKAQPQKDEVTVKIIERNGNDVRETERTYRIDGMTDPQRDAMVTKLVDSLKAARKDGRQRQLTIIVEENADREVIRERNRTDRNRMQGDAYTFRNRAPRNGRDYRTFEYRRNADSLADRFKRFEFQFPRDWDRQLARPFEDWARNVGGKPSTIRGLEAFPNNPDRNQLNVRFTAPAKGDVSIVVTNPKGKEVAKRDLRDFSGEFVGQIDLGRNPKGTYFVTVTQNEDGAVKRIVVE